MSVTSSEVQSVDSVDQASPYRTVVRAILTTASPLAIGRGIGTEDLKALGIVPPNEFFRGQRNSHDELEDCDALVMRDWQQRPYVPGSSLKGVVREWLTRPHIYNDDQTRSVVDWMLGTESTSSSDGAGGAVVFEDAFISDEKSGDPGFDYLPYFRSSDKSYVEQFTSIDRRTRTVHHTGLFNTEVVPAGLSFQVQLTVDHHQVYHQQAVELIVRALLAFSQPLHRSPPQLGASTRNGWGCMQASQVKSARWRSGRTPPRSFSPVQRPARTVDVVRRRRVTVQLRLLFHSLFLTCDPAKTVLNATTEKGPVFDAAQQEFTVGERRLPTVDQTPRLAKGWNVTNDDVPQIEAIPLLPAASFKGAIRSHIEKILRTIHPGIRVSPHGQAEPLTATSSDMVRQLLGHESQQSGLICTDFVGIDTKPLVWREMVAIDRFTGGAAAGAKFNVLAFERPTLTGTLAVDLPDHEDEAKAVLGAVILAVRDLIEGHISFGYGDMKGFGQCTAKLDAVHWVGFSEDSSCFGHELLTKDELTHLLSDLTSAKSEVKTKADQLINECLQAVRNVDITNPATKRL